MATCGELTLVSFVLRYKLPANAPESFATCVADFLVPDITLAHACEVSRAELLDLVWTRSFRGTKFCVATLLQSDKIYYGWEFSQAMAQAVRRADKNMIQWLLKHFLGCPVGENVVVEAAKGGHLWVLEVLEADNSHGGIQWNDESLGEAAKQGHWELVEWLDQRTSTPDSRERIYGVMDGAIQANDLELVKWVIANGFGVVAFGETSQVSYETNWAARKDILWYLLDGGYGESARVVEGALLQAADVGDLVLLQTLLARNEALDDPEDIYMDIWSSACGKGHIEVIQWLLIHPAYIAEPEAPCLAMIWAASNGRLEMINWLLHQDFSDASLDLNLFEVPSECNSGHTSEAVLAAAKNGHLGVIQLFHSLTLSIQKKHRMSKRHCRRVMYLEWSSAVMDTAAANGHLEVVTWLHASRSEGCTTKAMDEAAANGHLDVVRWLHSNRYEWLRVNRSEGCTINAMTGAATAGNIEVLYWLYDNAIAVCTQETMDVAACQGHLNVLEWLRNRYTARCTPDALDTAAINGHLKVVRWLLA